VHKIWAVIRREFVERVRQRWFWVMALLGPVFFGAIIVLPALLMSKGGVKHIAVVDGTTTALGAAATGKLDSTRAFRAVRVVAGPNVLDSLTAQVDQKALDGFLIVNDSLVLGKAEYRASNVSSFTAQATLENSLSTLVNRVRLEQEGVDPRVVDRAQVRLQLETRKISRGRVTGENAAESFSLAYFMGIILYMAILLYGINVMSSVLEEKTTRIVEVLVSSLKPFQLMLGKVIGVGAVSLFQFVIWGISGRLILSQRSRLLPGDLQGADPLFQIPHVTLATGGVFLAYFIGGFMLYSAMFAAVGAMSSNEQEARQAQQPVSMLLVLSFLGMFAMLNDPGSTFAITLSLVPFTSPIAMPVRWAAGSLPVSEVVLSLGILFVSIILVTWIASRIYRVGILMTGKRPNIKELVRWVRAA
jgi:ABC-2 type transport system permease protein